jgi:predicted DCC family thiol-disulfide oxidoreductase YuxK
MVPKAVRGVDEKMVSDPLLQTQPSAKPRTHTLIYDGQCRLCVTAKQGIERLGGDNEVRFVPYQSDEARAHLGHDYQPGRPDAAFLVEADGKIHRGLDAFLPLLPGLPGGRILLAMLRLPVLRPLAYGIYRLIARYRYQLFGTAPKTAKDQQSS